MEFAIFLCEDIGFAKIDLNDQNDEKKNRKKKIREIEIFFFREIEIFLAWHHP